MMLVAIFLVVFVGGPLIFRTMTNASPTSRVLRTLSLLALSCVIAGLLLRYFTTDDRGLSLWLSGAGVLLIWVAWIGVLAFVVQTLRHKNSSIRMRRWTGIIGALGTTIPWFGLVSANLIAG